MAVTVGSLFPAWSQVVETGEPLGADRLVATGPSGRVTVPGVDAATVAPLRGVVDHEGDATFAAELAASGMVTVLLARDDTNVGLLWFVGFATAWLTMREVGVAIATPAVSAIMECVQFASVDTS